MHTHVLYSHSSMFQAIALLWLFSSLFLFVNAIAFVTDVMHLWYYWQKQIQGCNTCTVALTTIATVAADIASAAASAVVAVVATACCKL